MRRNRRPHHTRKMKRRELLNALSTAHARHEADMRVAIARIKDAQRMALPTMDIPVHYPENIEVTRLLSEFETRWPIASAGSLEAGQREAAEAIGRQMLKDHFMELRMHERPEVGRILHQVIARVLRPERPTN